MYVRRVREPAAVVSSPPTDTLPRVVTDKNEFRHPARGHTAAAPPPTSLPAGGGDIESVARVQQLRRNRRWGARDKSSGGGETDGARTYASACRAACQQNNSVRFDVYTRNRRSLVRCFFFFF